MDHREAALAGEHHGDAVREAEEDGDPRGDAHDGVRPLLGLRLGAGHGGLVGREDLHHAVAVHLPGVDEARLETSGAQGREGERAVAGDGRGVVPAAVAQVETLELPRGAAARPLAESEGDPARTTEVAEKGHALRDVPVKPGQPHR